MFWRFSYSSSQIQTLLDKEDVTLNEIISEDDVLQECKSDNEKLIKFLTDPENMGSLLSNVLKVSDGHIDEKTCFKNSTISCELLTCDIPAVNDAFFENNLIDKLYSFLQNDAPLNPLLASYFAKIIGSLILRKTDQLLDYIQTKDDFADLFVRHINTSAVIDILLRFLTTIDNYEIKKKILEWLNKINIIEKIIELFSHTYSNEIHANAAQILCDIINISREQIVKLSVNDSELFFSTEFNIESNEAKNEKISKESIDKNDIDEKDTENETKTETENQMSESKTYAIFETNPLLNSLEKSENIKRLYFLIFESVGKPNCSIKDGIDVLLTLLNENTFYNHFHDVSILKDLDFTSLKGVNSVIINAVERVSCIHNFLKEYEPRVGFGFERLSMVKLVSRIISLNSKEFYEKLIKFNTMNMLLDYMFEYKWNNFLHTQLMNIIKYLFSNVPDNNMKEKDRKIECSILLQHILKDCNIIQKLVEIWTSYFDEDEIEKRKAKVAYIGHLVVISNLIWNCYLDEEKNHSVLKQILENDSQLKENWRNLNEKKIININNKFSKDLVRNPYILSNNDSNSENEMFELQNNEKINKKYAEFQREMKINCLDNFSLSENHIVAYQPKHPDLFNKLQSVSFQMDSSDETSNLFEQICQQRDNMCFNNEEASSNTEEDAWVSKEIKFSETFNSFSSSKNKENVMDISDDDFYLDSKKKNEKIPNNSDLTQVLFRKNNSSLTSSSSSSDDEENEIKKCESLKKEILFEEQKMDIEQKNTEQHFEIDKTSMLDLHSKITNKNSDVECFNEKFFNAAESDSPLNNVEWTDFSNFSTEKSTAKPSNNKTDVLTSSDPWRTIQQKDNDVETEAFGETIENDNWANFD